MWEGFPKLGLVITQAHKEYKSNGMCLSQYIHLIKISLIFLQYELFCM